RRVAAAADLGPRHVIGGDVLDPVLPACAQALAAGTINTGHITIIGTAVKKASAYLDAGDRAQLESTLVFIATTRTPPKPCRRPPTMRCICSTRTAPAPTWPGTAVGWSSAPRTPTD
ncbi:MAG: DUF222 domain-containing protein, partial [Mycobacterium sp.]